MSLNKCSVRGCKREQSARGWCAQHYDRWHRTGDVGSASIAGRESQPETCIVAGCDKPTTAKSYCQAHYRRWKLYDDPLGEAEKAERQTTCTVHECGRPVLARAMCRAHWERWRKTGAPGDAQIGRVETTCSTDGCTDPARKRGLCQKHYMAARGIQTAANEAERCIAEGCDRIRIANGYCASHYAQAKSAASSPRPFVARKCAVEGCYRKYNAKGYCLTHGRQIRLTGKIGDIRDIGNGHLTDAGYKMVKAPEHPNATATGYIMEHRLLMSQLLGRPLTDEENAHHRDGQRANNTIGPCYAQRECKCPGNPRHNLELWSTKQPRGQNVLDKVAFAREILALYGHLLPE